MSKVDVARIVAVRIVAVRIVAVILLLTGFVEIVFMALDIMGVEFSLWNTVE